MAHLQQILSPKYQIHKPTTYLTSLLSLVGIYNICSNLSSCSSPSKLATLLVFLICIVSLQELGAKTFKLSLIPSFLSEHTTNYQQNQLIILENYIQNQTMCHHIHCHPTVQTVIFSHLDYSNSLLTGAPAFALAKPTTSVLPAQQPEAWCQNGKRIMACHHPKILWRFPVSLNLKAKALQRANSTSSNWELVRNEPYLKPTKLESEF